MEKQPYNFLLFYILVFYKVIVVVSYVFLHSEPHILQDTRVSQYFLVEPEFSLDKR